MQARERGERAHHAGAAAELLQLSASGLAVRIDDHVADLARGPEVAAPHAAVDHDAGAHAGSHPHGKQRVGAFAGTHGGLAPGGHVGIVVDAHRNADLLAEDLAERHVLPAEVAGGDHHAALVVHRAGRTDSHGADVGELDLGVLAGGFHGNHQPLDDGVLAFVRLGLLLGTPRDAAAAVDHSHAHVGAAEVDADREFALCHGARQDSGSSYTSTPCQTPRPTDRWH